VDRLTPSLSTTLRNLRLIDQPLPEFLGEIRRFSKLGEPETIPRIAAFAEFAGTQDEEVSDAAAELIVNHDHEQARLGFSSLLEVAAQKGKSLGWAADIAEAMAEILQLLGPPASLTSAGRALLPNSLEAALAQRSYWDPLDGTREIIDPWSMLAVYRSHMPTAEDFAQAIHVLQGLGVHCAMAPHSIADLDTVEAEVLALVSGTWQIPGMERAAATHPEIDNTRIIWYAVGTGCSLGEAEEKARSAALRFGIGMTADIPLSLKDRRPTPLEWQCLSGFSDPDGTCPNVWPATTPLGLASIAVSQDSTLTGALDALSPLWKLGAAVPTFSDQERLALEHKPAEQDLWALSRDGDGVGPVRRNTRITPLALVHTAMWLGAPLRAAYDLYLPYRPFGLVLDSEDPGDLQAPLWEDLVLLSFAGNGQEPAIQGRVSERRITWAAGAVGRPGQEDWVLDRLRLYAEFFDLELPAPPDGGR